MFPDFNEGAVLLIDKPLRWTSFDVVNKIRNETRAKKVGHAGTLDPLATGLLIICTGKFTKKINEYQGMEKEYTGTIHLGATTPSYDLETEVDQEFDISHLNESMIREATKKFIGTIEQYPPAHSAKMISGERAYLKARRGEKMEMKANQVEVTEFEIINVELPVVHFRVVCSKGTYIRSLAHDLGKELGAGGYLSSLCRTRIGNFLLQDSYQMPVFIEEMKKLRADKAKS